jgi:hypothetical protein
MTLVCVTISIPENSNHERKNYVYGKIKSKINLKMHIINSFQDYSFICFQNHQRIQYENLFFLLFYFVVTHSVTFREEN